MNDKEITVQELEAIPHTDNTAVIAGLMTLDEAITHCEEKAALCGGSCGFEHVQLANWLKELRVVRKQVPVWHQCEYANADGFYDLPPEDGEYIVQFRTRAGKLVTTACEFDVDYYDWDNQPYGSTAIQWCELPTAPALKQNLITENKAGN